MKQHLFSFFKAVVSIVCVSLFLSSCNGEKIDSDLIDSITGKVSVEKITIDQEDFEMTEGESTVLTATVLPADATDKTVGWHSSKEDIVMISNTGKVMAIAPGKSIITAKAGNKTDFITITVIANAVRVTGISLDKTTLELKVGDSEALTATVTPPDATNKNVSWTSSDAAVATVENGKVTGVKPGSVTITAKTEDGGMTAECAVTVKTNLAPSVTVGAEHISAVSVVLQGKANLGPTVSMDLTLGFQYRKDAEQLAPVTKVYATGYDWDYNYSVILTGLEPGTVYSFRSFVTQDGKDTYGETMSFTTKDLASMFGTLDASEIADYSVTLNGKLDLTDVQCTTNEYGFYWGISEDSQTNYVKGGEIAENAYSAALTNLSSVTQYWYRAYLKLDDQTFYGDVKTVTTIWKPVTGVTLDKTEYVFHTIGETLTLDPTVSPSDASDKSVSWKSSDESVATVDQNGKVTAMANGTATITVTTKDQSKTATCEITVAQWVTGITLDKSALVLAEGKSETVSVASITPENANDKSVSWSSDNTSVATVDQNGQVTAKAKGRATITAAAKDGSGVSVSCGVYVSPIGTVDMGFSNEGGKTVYWATSNLSESGLCARPEDYGDYYAWGETQPYYAEGHSQDNPCSSWRSRTNPAITGYNWSSYKWCNGSNDTLTKYNTSSRYGSTVDNKTVLEANDDVAHVKLGGGWRMPTDAEWTELRNNCTWTWTKLNGVNGRLVTSNKSGASIFLPAAGGRSSTNLSSSSSSGGYYWSSSLNTGDPPLAYRVEFYSDGVYGFDGSRCLGFSVRPVSE